MIKIIALDLDNTIYDHRQYVEAAYKDISGFVSWKRGIDNSKFYDWILQSWSQKGSSYNRIFEEGYRHFHLKGFHEDIGNILELYHSVTPMLEPFEGTYEVLGLLSGKFKLNLITDGHVQTQMHKIRSLKIDQYFQRVYISAAFGSDYYKPSTKMFEKCLADEGACAEELVYIGDNPQLDFPPCKSMGISFVRLLKGENIRQKLDGVHTINDIKELPLLLERLE